MTDFFTGRMTTPVKRASGILGDVRACGSSIPEIPVDMAFRATRFVAQAATDVDDCRELLEMLGLTASQGLSMGDAA
jgi:hypothetical protein